MADYPDGAQLTTVAVTVDGIPKPAVPGTEYPAGDNGRYSGTATGYQAVATWTVTSTRSGKLVDVSMITSNYSKTNWKLVVAGDELFTGLQIGGALTKIFGELSLAGGDVVELSAASSDGTSITADGSITGKEVA